METITHCPLCNSTSSELYVSALDHHLTQRPFAIIRCTTCGFHFTNPRPSPSELGHYYSSDTYISHNNSGGGVVAKLYYWARRRALHGKLKTIRRLTDGRSLLDYGCGAGTFLAHMHRNGFRVKGIEPNDAARQTATYNGSLVVVPSLSALHGETFSVITLWHVLEHVHDLPETLTKLRSSLDPNGVLVIAVPDLTSWDAGHYAQHWAALDVPRHLSHFRPEDMQRLAQAHGLRIRSTQRLWLDAFYISMLSEKYRGRRPVLSLLLGCVVGCYSNLVSLLTGRSSSSTIHVLEKES